MPSPLRRTLRLTRRTAGYGFLVLLILAALLVSVANLLLPFIENNPQRVQAWLSERVGQPVRFQHSSTEWTRRGPRIRLSGLRVLNIGHAVSGHLHWCSTAATMPAAWHVGGGPAMEGPGIHVFKLPCLFLAWRGLACHRLHPCKQ